ncbi:S8 family serine peptidase [Pseudobacillus sp. 179-B 2D1 NHS]|uniref:S8 family serine peptidase n=1 Tax=Pseudobacillus sp. 179-B 2D1 NHS TaxID=3374292 RepID=UPI00387A07C6
MKNIYSAALAGVLLFSAFSVGASPVKAEEENTAMDKLKEGNVHSLSLPDREKKKQESVPGELIVQFKKGMKPESVLKTHGLKVNKKVKNKNVALVTFDAKKQTAKGLMKTLIQDKSIAHVQPNYQYAAAGFTNDSYSNELWGLNNTGQTILGQTGKSDMDINLPEAWNFIKDKHLQETVVAVIDTGTDINHPDLADKIWTNEKEKNGQPHVDDDGNGYVDDIHGWDFFNNDNTVYDEEDGDEHGTHVSGTIAASMDNAQGVAGIAPNAKIMPLKFLGPDGGSTFDAIQAIEYAQSMGVKISNNSWGGDDGTAGDALERAIADSGMLFVAAAGNDGRNIDSMPSYPASYKSENILTVAAVDNQGRLAGFSNYGKSSVDVSAPGVSILSTVPHRDPVSLPRLGAGVEVKGSNYKAIVNGFGFEHIASLTERKAAFQKAMNFLGDKSSPVLLVDDDESDADMGSYLSIYQELLKSLGYTYTTQTINQSENGPDANTLKEYKTVIWFTGDAYGTADEFPLTSTDTYSLETYMNDGGSLLLSGRDAIWGNEESSFVTDMLGIHVIDEFYAGDVEGVSGTAYESSNYQVRSIPYADFYSSLNPATTKVNLEYPERVIRFNEYEYKNGTSMAAPHVTGVAALMMGVHSSGTPAEIMNALKTTGKAMTTGGAYVASGKLIDAKKALEAYLPIEIIAVNELYDSSQYVEGDIGAKAKVTVKVNSTGKVVTQNTDVAGHFKIKIGYLPVGSMVTVKAAIGTKQTEEKTVAVLKDTVAPVLQKVLASDAKTLIEGQVSEEAKVQAQIGNTLLTKTPVATDANGNFKLAAGKLKAGDQVKLIIKDNAKEPNVTTVETEVKDETAPVIGKVNPVYNTSNYIEGSVNEAATVKISVVDSKGIVQKTLGTATSENNSFKLQLVEKLPKGTKLSLEATDTAQNKSKLTSAVVIEDRIPPKLLSPQTIVLTDKGEQVITGQLSEEGRVEVKVGENKIKSVTTDKDGNFTVTVPQLAANTPVTFIFWDSGTAKSEKKVTVTDGTNPVIQTNSVQPIYETSKYVEGKVSEAATVTALIDGKAVGTAKTDATGRFNILVNRRAPGTIITLIAKDLAKPKALESETVTVTVEKDTVAPQLLADTIKLNDASSLFEGKVSEEAKIYVQAGSLPMTKTPVATDGQGNFKIPVGKLMAGTNVTVAITDYAGLKKEEVLTVQDKTAPILAKVNPIYHTSSFVSGKVSERASVKLYRVDARLQIVEELGEGLSDEQGNFTVSLQTELPANTKVMVKAKDQAGQESKPVYTNVLKDMAAPVFLIMPVVSEKMTAISGKLNEPGTVVVKVNNNVAGETATNEDGSFTIQLDREYAAGTRITMEAKDKVGNKRSTVITVNKKIE